jgi:uncharacterized protein (DUF2141 family)
MKSALQEFKLLLNRTGAGSAYAAYALAFDPANGEYWVDGEQYGDPSEPFVTNAEAQTLARWFTDANATITKPASSIVITKVADGAGATWAFADAGRLVIGQRHRLRMNITVSDKARISIDGVTYDNGTTGWGFVADTPGTYDVDLSGVAHITGNFSIIVALANLVAWAANGATVTINSMTVDIEGVTALPGYSFTRTGEQGAVKSQTYGDELIVNGDGSSTTPPLLASRIAYRPKSRTSAHRCRVLGSEPLPSTVPSISMPQRGRLMLPSRQRRRLLSSPSFRKMAGLQTTITSAFKKSYPPSSGSRPTSPRSTTGAITPTGR